LKETRKYSSYADLISLFCSHLGVQMNAVVDGSFIHTASADACWQCSVTEQGRQKSFSGLWFPDSSDPFSLFVTTELSRFIRTQCFCTCEHCNSLADGIASCFGASCFLFSPLADCWEEFFHNLNPDTSFSFPDRGSGLWYSAQVFYPADHIGLRFFPFRNSD